MKSISQNVYNYQYKYNTFKRDHTVNLVDGALEEIGRNHTRHRRLDFVDRNLQQLFQRVERNGLVDSRQRQNIVLSGRLFKNCHIGRVASKLMRFENGLKFG